MKDQKFTVEDMVRAKDIIDLWVTNKKYDLELKDETVEDLLQECKELYVKAMEEIDYLGKDFIVSSLDFLISELEVEIYQRERAFKEPKKVEKSEHGILKCDACNEELTPLFVNSRGLEVYLFLEDHPVCHRVSCWEEVAYNHYPWLFIEYQQSLIDANLSDYEFSFAEWLDESNHLLRKVRGIEDDTWVALW